MYRSIYPRLEGNGITTFPTFNIIIDCRASHDPRLPVFARRTDSTDIQPIERDKIEKGNGDGGRVSYDNAESQPPATLAN